VNEGDVGRKFQILGDVMAGAVEPERRMGAGRDVIYG